jgi:hypothetical protein
MMEWFWAYLSRERSARLITGDADELRDALHFLNSGNEDIDKIIEKSRPTEATKSPK